MSDLPEAGTPPAALAARYDDRYLAGIHCFNRAEYFDAHEVWEALWMDCESADRRFFQSLIQAAVSLYHWGNGNRTGADRLFHSGQRYMQPYCPKYNGLEVACFWAEVQRVFSEPDFRPTIVLDPPPTEVHHE